MGDKNAQLLIICHLIFSYKNVWREYKSELYLFSKFGIPIHLWQCRIMPTHNQQMLHKCLSIEVSNKDACSYLCIIHPESCNHVWSTNIVVIIFQVRFWQFCSKSARINGSRLSKWPIRGIRRATNSSYLWG